MREELRQELGRGGIADSLERLKQRNTRWKQNCTLIEKRVERYSSCEDSACDLELQSGLYKKQTRKTYKDGQLASEQIEPIFDAGLYKALHDDELLTAREMGDMVTRNEVSGPGGKPIQIQQEVRVVGYALGGVADAVRYWLELTEAGRLPTSTAEIVALLTELDARESAMRQGKPVPPLSEVYNPALEKLEEEEGN